MFVLPMRGYLVSAIYDCGSAASQVRSLSIVRAVASKTATGTPRIRACSALDSLKEATNAVGTSPREAANNVVFHPTAALPETPFVSAPLAPAGQATLWEKHRSLP